MGDKSAAMAALTEVVSKDPLNGGALITLGSYHYEEEAFEKALDYYGRAEKVEDVKTDALLGSARVLVKLEKYREAISKLKEAQLIRDQPYVAQYISNLEEFCELMHHHLDNSITYNRWNNIFEPRIEIESGDTDTHRNG